MIIIVDEITIDKRKLSKLLLPVRQLIAFILKEKFQYKINDIEELFKVSRNTIYTWRKQAQQLHMQIINCNLLVMRKIQEEYIEITNQDNKYTVKYCKKNERNNKSTEKKNHLMAGETITSLVEDGYSKSKLGRMRIEKMSPEYYQREQKRIIAFINQMLHYYKPVYLTTISDTMWIKDRRIAVCEMLYKAYFSVNAITHILSNLTLVFKNPLEQDIYKSSNYILAYIWSQAPVKSKKKFYKKLEEEFEKERQNTLQYFNLYTLLDDVLENPLMDPINKLETGILTELLHDCKRPLNDFPIKQLIPDINPSVAQDSALTLFQKYANFLLNRLTFTVQYMPKPANDTDVTIRKTSKKTILKYIKNSEVYEIRNQYDERLLKEEEEFQRDEEMVQKDNEKMQNIYNIYYAEKEKQFRFRDIYKLKYDLSPVKPKED